MSRGSVRFNAKVGWAQTHSLPGFARWEAAGAMAPCLQRFCALPSSLPSLTPA